MSDKDMKLRLIVEAKNEADAALNDLNAGMRRTGKGADDLRGSMSLLSVAAKGAVAALAATVTIDAAARLVSLADAYTLAEGRLRLVTNSSTELAGVQDQLYASAQRTRTEYLSNVEGYARLAQNTKDLHLAQADLLTINETLNKAFIISGATEAERSATMTQLSQAFSSGVLRGEEFNSVAEQGSRVLQLLADYTGKSRGELRGMAEDGKLTADVLVQAILTGVEDVNEEFGKLPTTVSQAGNVLKNVLGGLVNDANKGSGATAGLAQEIIELADTVDTNRETILSLFSGVVQGAGWAFERVANLTNAMRGMAAVAAGALDFSEFVLMNPADFKQWDSDFNNGLDLMRQGINKAQEDLNTLLSAGLSYDDEPVKAAAAEVENLKKQLLEARKAKEALGKAGTSPQKDEQLPQDTNRLKALGEQYKAVGQAQGLEAEALEKLRAKVLPMRQAWEEYRKTVSDIEKAHAAGQFKNNSEYQQALGNAKKALNDATGATKAHNDALAEQEQAASKAKSEAERAAKSAKQAAETREREYQAIIDRLLPLEVAQRKYNEGLAALDKMDPTHGTENYQVALANLNREYQDAADSANRYAEEAEKARKAMEDAQRAAQESELSRKGTSLEISIAQGHLTEDEALPFQLDLLEQRLKLQQDLLTDMQKSTPEEVNAWNSQADAIARTTLELAEYQRRQRLLDPATAFQQGLQNYGSTANADLLDFYANALPDALDASTEAVSQFFRDFAQGNLTLGESWEALGESIEDTVFDILQDLLQLQLRMALLGGLGVTAQGGVTGGGLLGLFGAQHGGGTIGVDPPTFTRALPLSTFMGAPRFHTGLKGNEFPAILEGGESVLTEGQMAAIGKGLQANNGKQSAPQVNMTVIEAPGVKAETETRQNSDGSLDIVVKMIESKISDRMSRGQGLHKTMGSLYGARRRF